MTLLLMMYSAQSNDSLLPGDIHAIAFINVRMHYAGLPGYATLSQLLFRRAFHFTSVTR